MPIFQPITGNRADAIAKPKKATLREHLKVVPKLKGNSDEVLEQLNKVGGYSIIPNVLLDLLRGYLKRNEYDVFMYIVRRTLCFHKLSDAISMSQFQHGIVTNEGRRLDYGCGIKSSDSISRSLKELESLGYITRQAVTAANGASLSNIYTPCLDYIGQVLDNSDERSAILDDTESPDEGGGTTPSRGRDYPLTGEGVSYLRGDKTTVSQNKLSSKNQNKITNTKTVAVESPIPEVLVNPKVEIDTNLLTNLGLDKTTALQLAVLAEQNNKPEHYVTDTVKYCRLHATSNPAGLAKYLIKRGEERGVKPVNLPSSISKSSLPALIPLLPESDIGVEVVAPVPIPAEPRAVEIDTKQLWRNTCAVISNRFGNQALADLLITMQLVKLERTSEQFIVWLEPEAIWQTRLISNSGLRLIEQALRQSLNKPCVVKFIMGT